LFGGFHGAVEILRNTVTNNKRSGILLDSTDSEGTILIADNVLQTNGGRGFFTDPSGAHGVGLWLNVRGGSGAAVVRDNQILQTAGTGLAISSFSSPTLRGNTVTGSTEHGVLVYLPFSGASGTGRPDLGTPSDFGNNTLQGNGTADATQFFDLTNQTANPISAVGNRWDHGTAAEIDQFDIFDDEEGAAQGRTIGAVQFEPFLGP